jgi:hypothetical protein
VSVVEFNTDADTWRRGVQEHSNRRATPNLWRKIAITLIDWVLSAIVLAVLPAFCP